MLSKNMRASLFGRPSGKKGAQMHTYSLFEHLLFPPTFLNREKLGHQLEGKIVLITGASSGIGEQLAYLLSEIKVHLILVARREDKLLAMKSEIETKAAQISVFPADLRNQKEMEGLLTFLHQLPDGLDIIISNAGHSISRSIYHSLDRYHDFTRTMAINYFAPVQLLLSTLLLLEKKKGHIINVSTVNALLLPLPHWAAYQASKAASDTWFRSAAPELNMMGISTTSIYLPLVRTPMILPTAAYQNLPAMTPQHVAKIICSSIYTKRRTYKPWWLIFGQLASVLFRRCWEYSIPRMLRKKGNGNEGV
ncbi:SDR family NAD(P)-dependent oxidoreductase [Paenibacillus sp. V4I7]|uniref:SDR family NAD(P)-dependent oxidoreductase n=1 Tax=Paenibacillus sp. V4I7 TaxID=3042307 RepID=UPI002786074D|nr:SDR family NAD(P)-dependent oxidoreductase [Paenibacillus sp. V4I7]MDQ0899011.1 short-subunit dehydrogenase [Paenibacillus sp. V4I7]